MFAVCNIPQVWSSVDRKHVSYKKTAYFSGNNDNIDKQHRALREQLRVSNIQDCGELA